MTSPIHQFSTWLDEAKGRKDILEPTAMSLATIGEGGQPSVRIVLLKGHDERGFVFYTNFDSRKGRELLSHPKAALCFHWMPLQKQVRIEGSIEKVTDAEADAYFKSRVREKQIGAWASKQSESLDSMDTLRARVKEMEKKYEGKDVPRPPHWSGFRVMPTSIEFWQQGDHRLHERVLYTKTQNVWVESKLYP